MSNENKANKKYLCRRVSISLQRGTFDYIKSQTDKDGIKNFSVWAQEALRQAAEKLSA